VSTLWHPCMIFIILFCYCGRQNLDWDEKLSPFELGMAFTLFWTVAEMFVVGRI
jgi:hypothetical protein